MCSLTKGPNLQWQVLYGDFTMEAQNSCLLSFCFNDASVLINEMLLITKSWVWRSLRPPCVRTLFIVFRDYCYLLSDWSSSSDLWRWSWPPGSGPGWPAPWTSWWPHRSWLSLAWRLRCSWCWPCWRCWCQSQCWCYWASADDARPAPSPPAPAGSLAPAAASRRWERPSGCWGPPWSWRSHVWICKK